MKILEKEYKKLKTLKDPKYKDKLNQISIHALADTIDSIALIWLLTWDKYNKLKEGIEDKMKGIKKEGGIIK